MNFLLGCSEFGKITNLTKFIVSLIQYAVPVAIIILGSIDLFKAVIASKEDEIKAAQKLLLKRVIYGVVIFFLVAIVRLIFTNVGGDVGGIGCFIGTD